MARELSYCPQCGQKIGLHDTVCRSCNRSLSSEQTIVDSGMPLGAAFAKPADDNSQLATRTMVDAGEQATPSEPTMVTAGQDAGVGAPNERLTSAATMNLGAADNKLTSAATMHMGMQRTQVHPAAGNLSDETAARALEETMRREDASLTGQIFGRCKVMEKLGQGGMGTVYKAHHQTLDQYVVVKVLPASLARSAEFRERFLREARSCAKLYHQNVVQVLDAGYEQDVYFYIMEYVDGESLDGLMAHGKKFTVEEACRIIRDTAIGLEVAHKQGIIHRDIKASNIMLTQRGEVKVADFGLAYDTGAERISMTGQMLGTPQYMSPEQWEGTGVDARSDLYSLGITFYYLLSGKLPFQGPTPISILKKHVMERPESLKKLQVAIPPAVDAIVNRLLEKKKEARYASARELIDDLDSYLRGANPQAVRTLRRRQTIVAVTCLSLLAMLVSAGWLYWQHKDKLLAIVGKPADPVVQPKPDQPKPPLADPVVQPKPDQPKPPLPDPVVQPKPDQPKPPLPDPVVQPKPDQPKPPLADPAAQPKPDQPKPPLDLPKPKPLPASKLVMRGEMTITGLPVAIAGEMAAPLSADARIWLQCKKAGKEIRKFEAMAEGNQFQSTLADLPEGRYELTPIVARTDKSGEQKPGDGCRLVFDATPPRVKITSPQAQSVVYEEKQGKQIVITAKASDDLSPIASLSLSCNGRQIAMTEIGNGGYQATLPLQWGRQKYQISASDRAGHAATVEQYIAMVPVGMVRVAPRPFVLRGKNVELPPFYIDRTEVTNEAYEKYLAASGVKAPIRWPSLPERTDRWRKLPVVFVSQLDAIAYAQSLGKRLPNEAEWVAAALLREGQLNDFPWGSQSEVEWPQELLPVGSWKTDQSPCGVLDMAANVSEWTSEMQGDKPIRKGGYYLLKPQRLQLLKWATHFYPEARDTCNNWLGFRCALAE